MDSTITVGTGRLNENTFLTRGLLAPCAEHGESGCVNRYMTQPICTDVS